MRRPSSGESLPRNAAFALLAEASRAIFTGGLALYLVRALGPEDYGLYALALSVGMVALIPADFGISAAAARFVAVHAGERSRIAAVVRDALALKLVLASTMALVVAALAGPIADAYGEPGLLWPLRLVAAMILTQGVFQVCVSTLVGMGRTSGQALLYLTEGATETIIVVLAVTLGAGAAGATGGRAAAFALAAVAGLALVVRRVGSGAMPRLSSAGQRRRVLGYAGALFVIDAGFLMFEQIDVLILGAYMGSESAGVFQATLRVVVLASLVGLAIGNAVAPRMARLRQEPEGARTLATAIRVLVVFASAATAVAVAWADPVVRLVLGPEYNRSADILTVLGPFLFLSVLGPLVTVAVNYLGAARQRIPAVVGLVVLQVVLDVLLIPRYDELGPAIGTDIVFTLYVGYHLVLLQRLAGLDLRALGLGFVRSLLAGGALAGVLLTVGSEPELPATSWLLGLSGGLAAFGAVLWLTGELRGPAVREALRLAAGVVRR